MPDLGFETIQGPMKYKVWTIEDRIGRIVLFTDQNNKIRLVDPRALTSKLVNRNIGDIQGRWAMSVAYQQDLTV